MFLKLHIHDENGGKRDGIDVAVNLDNIDFISPHTDATKTAFSFHGDSVIRVVKESFAQVIAKMGTTLVKTV